MASATAEGKVANTGQTGGYAPRHELTFWKPTKAKTGSAAIFQFTHKNGDKEASFWLNVMPESGNETGPKFNKEGQLTAKLGITDMGEILACLSGRNGGLGRPKDNGWSGLYHQNATGNTVIALNPNDKAPGHYWLNISVQRDGASKKLAIGLTPGDQELLLVFIRTYLPQMFFS